MRRWKHRVEVVRGDKQPEAIALELVEGLRKLPEDYRALEHSGTSLDEIVEWLEGAAAEVPCLVEHVDAVLRELWDWGDEHSLWVFVR